MGAGPLLFCREIPACGAAAPRRAVRGRGMAAARLPLLGLRLGRGVPRPLCSRLFARHSQVSAAKRAKAAGDEAGKASPLSPEQLERIRKNKEAALQRLAERNVPPGFGESWRRQLAGEFSKPYFVEVSAAGLRGRRPPAVPGLNPPSLPPQLMAFVAEERKRYTVYPPPDQVFTWTQMCDIRDVSRAAGAGERWGRRSSRWCLLNVVEMQGWMRTRSHLMFGLLSFDPGSCGCCRFSRVTCKSWLLFHL